MREKNNVQIEGIKGAVNEYLIKDSSGINAGRFVIFDMNKENKRCSLRINIYKKDNLELIENSLQSIIKTIFKDQSVHKINIHTLDNLTLEAFTNCGMELQGILVDNVLLEGHYENELVFGIDAVKYNSLNINNPLNINDSNMVLKILAPHNAEELLQYYIKNKNHLKNFEPFREEKFYTLETQKKLLSESYRQFLMGNSYDFGIFVKDKFIGKVKLSNIVYGAFKSGILGYSLDESCQGKGYMTEAVSLVCQYAFEELELHRIEASTLVDNIKSQKVLKRCGFMELGLNKNYLYINGKWQDHITFYRCQTREK